MHNTEPERIISRTTSRPKPGHDANRIRRNRLVMIGTTIGLGTITIGAINANKQADLVGQLKQPEPQITREVKAGQIDSSKVVNITAPESGLPYTVAGDVSKASAVGEVSDIITAEADNNGEPIQGGTQQLTLPKADVLPKYLPPK